jgi:uncharacterized RDD family membrane protein YckC
MMDFEPAYNRLQLAQLGQRVIASVIDLTACVFLGQLIEALLGITGSPFGWLIFAAVWMGDRVLVASGQGQSIGRWLMSLRVVDMEYGKSAGLFELFRREILVFTFLALVVGAFSSPTAAIVFAVIPIVVDLVIAIADTRKVQTLHDKIGGTIVIVTRKGFQLDQKLGKVFGQVSRRTAQVYQDKFSDPYQERERGGRDRYQDRNQDRYQDRDRDQDRYQEPDEESYRPRSTRKSDRPAPRPNTRPVQSSDRKPKKRRR